MCEAFCIAANGSHFAFLKYYQCNVAAKNRFVEKFDKEGKTRAKIRDERSKLEFISYRNRSLFVTETNPVSLRLLSFSPKKDFPIAPTINHEISTNSLFTLIYIAPIHLQNNLSSTSLEISTTSLPSGNVYSKTINDYTPRAILHATRSYTLRYTER